MVYSNTYENIAYTIDGQVHYGDLYVELEVDSPSRFTLHYAELKPQGKDQAQELSSSELETYFPLITRAWSSEISEYYTSYMEYLADQEQDR